MQYRILPPVYGNNGRFVEFFLFSAKMIVALVDLGTFEKI